MACGKTFDLPFNVCVCSKKMGFSSNYSKVYSKYLLTCLNNDYLCSYYTCCTLNKCLSTQKTHLISKQRAFIREISPHKGSIKLHSIHNSLKSHSNHSSAGCFFEAVHDRCPYSFIWERFGIDDIDVFLVKLAQRII